MADAHAQLVSIRRANYYFIRLRVLLALLLLFVTWGLGGLNISGVAQWMLGTLVLSPFIILLGLWEANVPNGADYIWPKVWFFRGQQIWPRQK